MSFAVFFSVWEEVHSGLILPNGPNFTQKKNSDSQEGKRDGLLLSVYHLKGLISLARKPRLRFLVP